MAITNKQVEYLKLRGIKLIEGKALIVLSSIINAYVKQYLVLPVENVPDISKKIEGSNHAKQFVFNEETIILKRQQNLQGISLSLALSEDIKVASMDGGVKRNMTVVLPLDNLFHFYRQLVAGSATFLGIADTVVEAFDRFCSQYRQCKIELNVLIDLAVQTASGLIISSNDLLDEKWNEVRKACSTFIDTVEAAVAKWIDAGLTFDGGDHLKFQVIDEGSLMSDEQASRLVGMIAKPLTIDDRGFLTSTFDVRGVGPSVIFNEGYVPKNNSAVFARFSLIMALCSVFGIPLVDIVVFKGREEELKKAIANWQTLADRVGSQVDVCERLLGPDTHQSNVSAEGYVNVTEYTVGLPSNRGYALYSDRMVIHKPTRLERDSLFKRGIIKNEKSLIVQVALKQDETTSQFKSYTFQAEKGDPECLRNVSVRCSNEVDRDGAKQQIVLVEVLV